MSLQKSTKETTYKKTRIRINKTEFFPPKGKIQNMKSNGVTTDNTWDGKISEILFGPDPFLNHEKALDILSLLCRESSLLNLLAIATDPDHFVHMAPDPHQFEKLNPDPHQVKSRIRIGIKIKRWRP